MTKSFRQAQQVRIVVNAAHRPVLVSHPDFFRFICDDTEATAALVSDIVARRIPAWFGLGPRRDVQILCPMHHGLAGASNLNLLLPGALIPYGEGAPRAALRRPGVPGRRQGAAGVFNGTTGVVAGLPLVGSRCRRPRRRRLPPPHRPRRRL